jgi:hypothetical protein
VTLSELSVFSVATAKTFRHREHRGHRADLFDSMVLVIPAFAFPVLDYANILLARQESWS